jgi:hypothetical protein
MHRPPAHSLSMLELVAECSAPRVLRRANSRLCRLRRANSRLCRLRRANSHPACSLRRAKWRLRRANSHPSCPPRRRRACARPVRQACVRHTSGIRQAYVRHTSGRRANSQPPCSDPTASYRPHTFKVSYSSRFRRPHTFKASYSSRFRRPHTLRPHTLVASIGLIHLRPHTQRASVLLGPDGVMHVLVYILLYKCVLIACATLPPRPHSQYVLVYRSMHCMRTHL